MEIGEVEVGAGGPMWESAFIANMARLRRSRGVSQSELARRVGALGITGFHQQTVQRVESGDRPVRLNEAYVIAQALGTRLEELILGDPLEGNYARARWAVRDAVQEVQQGAEVAAGMVEDVDNSRVHLRELLDELRETWSEQRGGPLPHESVFVEVLRLLDECFDAGLKILELASMIRHPSLSLPNQLPGVDHGVDPEA